MYQFWCLFVLFIQKFCLSNKKYVEDGKVGYVTKISPTERAFLFKVQLLHVTVFGKPNFRIWLQYIPIPE
jgi:hypothetical protein